MFNRGVIDRLCRLIREHNGIADKVQLAQIVADAFSLNTERKVYCGNDFAIRFSKSESRRMSNTVLSLSALKKYDDKPFLICIVSSTENYLLLANSTFLKKISHSSTQLRMDNIKGSFNGTDIMTDYQGLENEPAHFEALFSIHEAIGFEGNLRRLVESTNEIVGHASGPVMTPAAKKRILQSIDRTQAFLASESYQMLKDELNKRTRQAQADIIRAAQSDNVNLRGRMIEFLITEGDSKEKRQLIRALREGGPVPEFKTRNTLGDFAASLGGYTVQVDIKTKMLYLDSAPKAYNVDKLLAFLSTPGSVYMIYIVGVAEDGRIVTRLCPFMDKRLIAGTTVQHHWAGRQSRGVTQLAGRTLHDLLCATDRPQLDEKEARAFLQRLIG